MNILNKTYKIFILMIISIFLVFNLCGCENINFSSNSNDQQEDTQDQQLGINEKFQAYSTYFYEQLTPKEQECYKEILAILQKCGEKVKISISDKATIDKIYSCVMNDHPEIFYVSGYSLTQSYQTYFSGTYIYSREEINSRKQKIDEYVTKCFAQIPTNADSYIKVKNVYEYIIKNTQYESVEGEDQNICSVFILGKSVCMGYSKATQYLLNCLGVKTILVTGHANIVINGVHILAGDQGDNHAWNQVLIDGNWYCVDTTWGGGFSSEGSSDKGGKPINYDYLLCTTDEFNIAHKVGENIKVPLCNHSEQNYFVREGAYFETVDLNKFGNLAKRCINNKKHVISIKCGSQEIYSKMKKILLQDGKIRDYVPKNQGDNLYQSSSDDMLTITFFF